MATTPHSSRNLSGKSIWHLAFGNSSPFALSSPAILTKLQPRLVLSAMLSPKHASYTSFNSAREADTTVLPSNSISRSFATGLSDFVREEAYFTATCLIRGTFIWVARDHDAARILAKQHKFGGKAVACERGSEPNPLGKRLFGKRHRQSALRAIMRRVDQTPSWISSMIAFCRAASSSRSSSGRISPHCAKYFLRIVRRAKLGSPRRWHLPVQWRVIARQTRPASRKGIFADFVNVVKNADDADDRRGIDSFAQSFVVKAYVAASDGNLKLLARFGDSVDDLRELPHDVRLFWIAKVQAICRAHRSRSHTRHVSRGFGDGVHGTKTWVEVTPASVAIERHSESASAALDADNASVGRARASDRVGQHHVIVLLPHPALAADVRTREQRLEILSEVAVCASLTAAGISRSTGGSHRSRGRL